MMTAPAISPAFRTLPHHVEAEKIVLGSLMVFPRAWEQVAFLKPEHFALRQNGRIFAAAAALVAAGKLADPVTLRAVFDEDSTLQEIGGQAYLVELATAAVGPIAAAEYAAMIRDLWAKREMIAAGEALVDRAYSGDVLTDPRQLAEDIERKFAELVVDAETERPDTLAFIEARYQNPGSLLGVPSGFGDLDRMLCGFQAPDLILLAGRPSMGKSTLAGAIAAKCGEPCGLLELEQSAMQTELRLIADRAGVPLNKTRTGHMSPVEWHAIEAATAWLRALPLHIIDMSAPSAETIRAKARELKRKHGIKLLIIDQLTHVTPPDGVANPVQQLGMILKVFKATSKDIGIPIIVLHQLNRALEARDDKRPGLSDLRDSGHLEQDADVVIFIYREEYYLARSEPSEPDPSRYDDGTADPEYTKANRKRTKWGVDIEAARNVAEIIVAKQRMGPVGTVRLYYDATLARFRDLEQKTPAEAGAFRGDLG